MREGHVHSISYVVFLSHSKGKRRSTVLWYGNRTFLICSLAVVIRGTGFRAHPPLAWNWVLQDEIERARVSFLAAMCHLLGEGVRKARASPLRQGFRGRACPCWFAGRAWWAGSQNPGEPAIRQCTVRISRLWWAPHRSTRCNCITRGRRRDRCEPCQM